MCKKIQQSIESVVSRFGAQFADLLKVRQFVQQAIPTATELDDLENLGFVSDSRLFSKVRR